MKRLLPLIYIVILLFPVVSWADELDDTTNALNQKQSELQQAKETLESAKKKEAELSGGLSPLQASLNTAIAEVEVKQAEVNAALADLDYQEKLLKNQQSLRDIRVRELYKKVASEKANQVVSLLDADNLVTFAKISAYQSQVLAEEERLILDLNNQVEKIDKKRVELQAELDGLDEQKKLAQQRVDNLRYQISLAQSQQYSSGNQIASLNKDIQGLAAKQQEILAAKAAANAAGGSLGDKVPVTMSPAAPDFSGQAYAFASYGVPHRVGLSQYGAYGRAQAGQNYQQILNAYFNNIQVGPGNVPSTINVQGYGNMSFEDMYMIGIHEMPRSWSLEALKAQAILARTYAAKWLNDNPGGAICTTQSCQVYHNDQPGSSNVYDQRWYQAVNETRGIIITQNGSPIGAYYSSVAGGITQQSGQVWYNNLPYLKIAEDCNGSWPKNCYDAISPWFHKPWGDRYGRAETSTGTNCPTCNPWLTKEEMMDLLNTALYYEQHNNSFSGDGRIATVASGGYSYDEMRSKVDNPITDFGGLDVYHNKGVGQTVTLRVWGGNRGSVNINAASVYAAVNVRAPGTIFLNSKLFDVIYP